ncbi:leucine-rich repeat domain-containing protein [Treponema medium]|uniref:Leucine-rich repeat domain-containing protein n=4 Tax=Treponema medium TaxID=58231 RepID=A0ABX7M259_TREMD|nr:leucine-rich repeat domain-containing protein [Treponema medium]
MIKEWKVDGAVITGNTENSYIHTVTKAVDVKVSFEALPPGKASYTVKHYREKPEGGYPAEPAEREILNGTVGADAAYTAKIYEGFTYNSSLTKINGTVQTSGTISADNATAVELYYERKTVNVTFKLAGGTVDGNTDDIVKTGKYGTDLTVPAPVKTGAVFKGWEPALPSSPLFPAADTEYTAKWQNVYTINFSVEGSTGGALKAEVDGNEITTGDSVEQGKSVVFTAEPAPDYVVEQWTNGGTVIAEAGMDTSYTYTATADADIKVKFQSLFVEGGASLILSPDKLDITVKVTTADNSSVTVEGCTETTLTSGAETVLHAKGRKVILKGNITALECRYNRLTALNVQGLTALQGLYCGDNQLTELNVQGLTALQGLQCGGNQLTSLDVQGLTALKELWCNGNQLTALNVQGLTALQRLHCGNNQLTALNVQDLTALQELNCAYSQLTALNVQDLTALQELNCYSNQLTALNVQGLTALQELQCGGNQLTELNVQDCTALQELICSSNQLTALNAQGLTALRWLYCGSNQLTELNVQSLTALKELWCHDNQLTTLNIQGLTALRTLRCYNNKLTAQAFTKLFDDLPARQDSDAAMCVLYTEYTGVTEGNHTDFTAPPDLAAAFNNAKTVKKWKMYKMNGSWSWVEI